MDKSLEVVKLEEAKYAYICVSVYANTAQFMHAGIVDLGLFWSQQKSPSGSLLALDGGGGVR